MIDIKDAKEIIKTEYGRNLKVLMIVDENEDVSDFIETFNYLFRQLVILKCYEDSAKHFDENQDYDVVIVHINKEAKKAKDMIKSLRKKNHSINVLVFSTSIDIFYKESEHCACADGVLPYPLDIEFTYKFLYRFLKKITEIKELKSYVVVLENMINFTNKSYPEIDRRERRGSDAYSGPRRRKGDRRSEQNSQNNVGERRRTSDNQIKNIRFNQPNKLSASEFMSTLDVTIIDKIEVFQEELDNYFVSLYDMEELNEEDTFYKIDEVNNILIDFFNVVDSITTFPIITETFMNLTDFIRSLKVDDFSDIDKKKLLIEVLIGLGKDLETWTKTIFVEQSTNDIHYFDASFANNCVEIEALFYQTEIDGEDDDLEFF